MAFAISSISAELAAEERPKRPDENGFIRDWLIGGPFPNHQTLGRQMGYEDDLLLNLGGEAQAEPYGGLTDEVEFFADKGKLITAVGSANEWGYTETKRFPVTWRYVQWTNSKPIIALDKMFPPLNDYIVAYAFCTISSPTAKKIKVRIGSDDDHKVWLNGKMLGGESSAHGAVIDNFIYEAELRRGLNRLLLKVVNRLYGHGFCLALSDMENGPLRDVSIMTDDPKRVLQASVSGLKRVDCWDGGYYAGFDLGSKNAFAGKNALQIQAGVPQAGRFEFQFVAENNGKVIISAKQTAELKKQQLLNWSIPVTLPSGPCDLTLKISGDGEAVLSKREEVLDPIFVKKETEGMKLQLASVTSEIAEVQSEQIKMKDDIEAMQKRREQLYREIEAAYEDSRANLISNPPSINESVNPASTPRRRICLNGDVWLVADGKNIASKTPPAEGWRAGKLPMRGKPLSPRVDPPASASQLWLRRDIDLDATTAKMTLRLICENVHGRLAVTLNGNFCGEFSGVIGIAEIPLQGAVPGKNRIDLYVEGGGSRPDLPIPTPWVGYWDGWGLRGDLFLECTAPVCVSDVEIKTSWRKAKIEVISEIENNGKTPINVRLDQFCVLNGNTKYRLPAQIAQIDAGGKVLLKSQGIWKEAVTWGIGSHYGRPTLYEMFSDVYADGALVDRQVTTFGFREFWIAGTDFYLNGRRIQLQGDEGQGRMDNAKMNDVLFPLLRADGINTMRNHDGEFWSVNMLRSCDTMGMLAYVQMYPILFEKPQPHRGQIKGKQDFIPYDDWFKHPFHQINLRNYERWVKMLRNHPSVVIASTDNEVFTQSDDVLERREYNIRNDRLAAYYGNYVKSLNPALVMTRDGDQGTWGHAGRWQEDPPCDTANYHYPDFNINEWVLNWQSAYDFRPVIFGETLYYAYGGWDNMIGPIPSQVAKEAAKVRAVASLYRRLGIPGQMFMGLSWDGFIMHDNTGNGNPWRITADEIVADIKKAKDHQYFEMTSGLPFRSDRLPPNWPSQSGYGVKDHFKAINLHGGVINWFDPDAPSHVRNAVNDAYRDSLIPQPPLEASKEGECIIELGLSGKSKVVSAVSMDGIYPAVAVAAALDGTAWFRLPRPGKYRFECDGIGEVIDVPSRGEYAVKPGFNSIARFSLNPK